MRRKPLMHEIIDQILHFAYGLVATAGLSALIPLVISVPIVTLLALIRERTQHPNRRLFELFNKDMWFVLAGQAAGIAITFI